MPTLTSGLLSELTHWRNRLRKAEANGWLLTADECRRRIDHLLDQAGRDAS